MQVKSNILPFIPVFCAFSAFSFFLLNMPVHPHDDLKDIQRFLPLSFPEALTITYLRDSWGMYRPVIGMIIKSLYNTVGLQHIWFRLAELALVVSLFASFIAIGKRLAISAVIISIALLYLLGSPFLFHAYTWWGDIGSLIILNCFAISFITVISDKGVHAKFAIITTSLLIGLFSKEVGITLVVFVIYFLKEKRFLLSALFLLPLFAYLWIRIIVIGSLTAPEFIHDTGFFFTRLSVEEIRSTFPGWRIHLLEAYTVLSQLLAVSTGLFKNGVFSISWKTIPILLTSAVLCFYFYRQIRSPDRNSFLTILLLFAIILGGLLSYKYARPRLLPVPALSYAILTMLAFARLQMEKALGRKQLVGLLASVYISWFAMSISSIRDVHKEGEKFRAFYLAHEVSPTADVSAQLYRAAREDL